MILAILAGILAVAGSQDESNFTVELKDGSRFQGRLKGPAEVRLKTGRETRVFSLKDLRGIRWGDVAREEKDTVVTDKEIVRGWLEKTSPFEFDTGFGTLKIPEKQMKAFRRKDARGRWEDDFELGLLDRWSAILGDWKVSDGQLQMNGMGVILFEETLPESYTMEIQIQGANTGVMWAGNFLMVGPGMVFVISGRGGIAPTQGANWPVKLPPGKPYILMIDVRGRRSTISINDKKLGTITTPQARGRFCISTTTGASWFDNFRITKK